MIPFILAAASLAIKAGSAVAAHKAQNKASAANLIAANGAANAENAALSARALEEGAATAQSIDEGQRQSMSAASMARISAVSSGVAGQSADAILGSLAGDLGRYTSSAKQNLDLSLLQIDRARLGVEARREERINAVPRANPFLTGLSIAGAGLDFATYRARTTPT